MEVSPRAEHILNTRTGTLQSGFFQLDSGSAAALLVDGSRQMEVSNLGTPGAVSTHTGALSLRENKQDPTVLLFPMISPENPGSSDISDPVLVGLDVWAGSCAEGFCTALQAKLGAGNHEAKPQSKEPARQWKLTSSLLPAHLSPWTPVRGFHPEGSELAQEL